MSAARATKVFGIRMAVDPKILIGSLVALAALLFWYNSRSDEGTSTGTPATTRPAEATQTAGSPAATTGSRTTVARRSNDNLTSDRSRLRVRPIDATRGDIDPTLRLDLLSRLSTVKYEPARRSVFEIGAAPTPAELLAAVKNKPIINPKPPTPTPQYPTITAPPPVNIPLKYYGFAKPMEPGQVNRGFFLDGDNVLMASEGQVLKQKYLVVELAPNTARVEDTAVKQGQTLPVVTPATTQ
ncbi:MAG: hypothetical protein JOZ45_09490 [Acidobacteriaceae bacterium]|nr:hypothetical protein [Acidobacteriaceae bacterium]MBV9306361.1 hypothetical protein [Acidobacteriaceae bacterium]